MNKKIIIGVAGQIASGKGTVAEYMENNYRAKIIKYSDILKDVLKRLYLEINRDNLQKLSTSLRGSFGQNILAKTIKNDAKKIDNKIIIIDGVRRKEDINNIENKNFYRIYVDADMKTRYKRITGRREKSDDKKKTYKEFKEDQRRETEITIQGLKEKSDLVLDNNGTIEQLEKQVREFIKNLV